MAEIAARLVDAEIEQAQPPALHQLAGAGEEHPLPVEAALLDIGLALAPGGADHVDMVGNVAGIARNVVGRRRRETEMKAVHRKDRLMEGGAGGEDVEIVDLGIIAGDVRLSVDHPEDLAEIVA